MERDREFDQEGLELTCLDLFKVLNLNTHNLVVVFLIDTFSNINTYLDIWAVYGANANFVSPLTLQNQHLSTPGRRWDLINNFNVVSFNPTIIWSPGFLQ